MSSPFSRPGAPAPKGTAASRRYRALLWLYLLAGLTCVAVAVAAQRRVVAKDLQPFAMIGAVAALLGAIVSFNRGRALSAEERAHQERTTMTLILAAELGRQDDAALERVARQSGMAGEAARGILAERRRKRGESAAPDGTAG